MTGAPANQGGASSEDREVLIAQVALDLVCPVPEDPTTWRLSGEPCSAEFIEAVQCLTEPEWQVVRRLAERAVHYGDAGMAKRATFSDPAAN